MLKTGQQEKFYSSTDVSVSQQCRAQLLSVKLQNLVHSIFRNENSTLEINVSHFGLLHWQYWQPPASVPVHLLETVIFLSEFSSPFFKYVLKQSLKDFENEIWTSEKRSKN